jgi:hypothetical protein
MRTKSRIRSLAFGLVGLAALATSGTGCVIESSGGGGPCLPDLVVPWSVVQNNPPIDTPITCGTAGADSVDLDVNGEFFMTQLCSPSQGAGNFVVPLANAGSFTLDVFLVAPNGAVLSEAHPPTVTVGCGGFTTPTVVLPVNL